MNMREALYIFLCGFDQILTKDELLSIPEFRVERFGIADVGHIAELFTQGVVNDWFIENYQYATIDGVFCGLALWRKIVHV